MFLVLFFFLFSFRVHAQDFFDYRAVSTVLFEDNKVPVNLFFDVGDVPLTRFRIRVLSNNGFPSIKIGENKYLSNDLWLLQPSLTSKFEIEVAGNFLETEVWFEILDLHEFKKYATPKYILLNNNWFRRYITELNDNLMKW